MIWGISKGISLRHAPAIRAGSTGVGPVFHRDTVLLFSQKPRCKRGRHLLREEKEEIPGERPFKGQFGDHEFSLPAQTGPFVLGRVRKINRQEKHLFKNLRNRALHR